MYILIKNTTNCKNFTTDCKKNTIDGGREFYHREILRPIGRQIDKTLNPISGNYIGGDNIYVSGPCFKTTNTYIMKFNNDKTSNCIVIDTTKSICVKFHF